MTSGLSYMESWLSDALGDGSETNAGIYVSTKSAMGYPPVWYAINKIGGHIGQMPLIVRKRLPRGSEAARTHPAYRLMKNKPNQLQTAIGFKETIMAHALLLRSGRAAIIRDAAGRPIELILMTPDRTVTVLSGGKKWHVTNVDADDPLAPHVGKQNRAYYKIPDEDVLHIVGLSWNGIDGLSIIDIARETFGLGIAGQKATSRNFKNNAKPGIVIEAPVGMFPDQEDAQQFLDDFNKAHSGLDAAGKAGLLREGMKLSTLAVSAKDAEWLNQRKFERQDTALLFLLESILGDDSSVSYNSLEQKNLAYMSNCLMRWMVKWEQECDEKLLTERQKERDTHFFKFNEKALLRADSNTQMLTITGYIQSRVMSPNEGRELMDMMPYDGGDEYLNPAITVTNKEPGSDDKDPAIEQAMRIARSALVDRLGHLGNVEAKQVLDAVKFAKNYNDWLDQFYTTWEGTLSKAIVAVGGNATTATKHCERSKGELSALTDTAKSTDELAGLVGELTETWTNRAGELADTILEIENEYETV